VLAVATGIAEHDGYGVAFIEAVRWIKQNLPHAKTGGGISNLSFALRGNNTVREAMHSVFLYHAVEAGLDMGIVNPAMLQVYSDIPAELLALCEDVVLNRRADATERLMAFAQTLQGAQTADAPVEGKQRGELPLGERIATAMHKGAAEFIEADIKEAYAEAGTPMAVIDRYLMPSMERVGDLFAEGKMFLPQVVKSARVMRLAVDVLTPYMTARTKRTGYAGKVLLATVKGDVHDIGKNIASVVMACNGYEIKDLGVMVQAQDIVEKAIEWGADAIGLSALITPSLEEMAAVLRLLERRGVLIPVLIGGATTSPLHTAVKLAPLYSGLTVHVRDASQNVKVLSRLGNDRDDFADQLREEQSRLRGEHERHAVTANMRSLPQARRNGHVKQPMDVSIPLQPGRVAFHDYPIGDVIPYIDWSGFFPSWGMKGRYPELLDSVEKGAEARKLLADAGELLEKIAADRSLGLHAALGLFTASSIDDDIVVWDDDRRSVLLPQLRNQSDGAGPNLCLADYVLAHQTIPEGDHIGVFAVTAGVGLERLAGQYRDAGDDYRAIMCKLLADRLTEALAEVMHAYMRRQMWGFEKGRIAPEQALAGQYRGKRYAFGYPACPDHSLKREVFELLRIGDFMPMSLTENFMISPGESLCGIVLSHPAAEYFPVGRIDEEQLADYAARRAMTVEQIRRLIPNNVQ
jgi:5-methyltetrahydrofolate--homocysteine methyltransferase